VGRIILHADLDAFYASVEQLDTPELRGKPVVVGGPPEARGVVAAASYEARRFGARSAMPMSRALRLCPDAVRLSPRFDRYGEVSRKVMGIFRSVTPLVEPLSLDEAFLDVTEQVAAHGGGEALARRLKQAVKRETGLTLSVGVGSNKTIAKVASDMGKPDGLAVVPPGDEATFLEPLPVRSLWGIGPKTEARLAGAGIRTVGQLARAPAETLATQFGSQAAFFQRMARGEDDRPVETESERKSVGAETTFPRDLPDGPDLREQLSRIAEEVAQRLVRQQTRARTVVLKLRYADFRTITRQATRPEPTDEAAEVQRVAETLLDKVVRPGDRFRLLGIHCSHLTEGAGAQFSLWESEGASGGGRP